MQPLDSRDRRWALALTMASAVIVLVLAARVHHGGAPLWLDIQGQRVADGRLLGIPLVPARIAHMVVSLGGTEVFATLVAAVVLAALALRDRVSALVALAACPLALLATEMIGKPLVGRRELAGGGYAFPSGHTTAIATLVAVVALVAYRRWRGRGLAVIAPAALLVPAMALALTRFNLHLFSDTIAGALVGGGTVVGMAWLFSVLLAAWARRHRRAPGNCRGTLVGS